ncbi:MSHA pilin protein MshA [Thiogranum longum]|uniref:MSHA pilin protein MshA n=1 Tax=Thiogranum longum TaxID=1537524 RepID=A0A4R1H586_9GAMM|nr:type II secretion system protein [Thiogranum longum]TCK16874.1 MSHA pilin protein MshA [Thiogranum longum]
MKKEAGFTLIELVAVLVILALLGAMAVPRFVDVSGQALTAAQNGSLAGVRSGHAMAIADLRRLPTVTELSTYVGGPNISAVGTGIQVVINGTNYTVETFTDTTCTAATAAVADTVGCIGTIN